MYEVQHQIILILDNIHVVSISKYNASIYKHLPPQQARLSETIPLCWASIIIIQTEIKIIWDFQVKFPSLGYQEFYRYPRNVS